MPEPKIKDTDYSEPTVADTEQPQKGNQNGKQNRLMHQIDGQRVLAQTLEKTHRRQVREIGQGKTTHVVSIKSVAHKDANQDDAEPGNDRGKST